MSNLLFTLYALTSCSLPKISGHGGKQCAEYLSRHLHNNLATAIRDEALIEFFDKDIDEVILNTCEAKETKIDAKNAGHKIVNSNLTENKKSESKIHVSEEADLVNKSSLDRSFPTLWAEVLPPIFKMTDLVRIDCFVILNQYLLRVMNLKFGFDTILLICVIRIFVSMWMRTHSQPLRAPQLR